MKKQMPLGEAIYYVVGFSMLFAGLFAALLAGFVGMIP